MRLLIVGEMGGQLTLASKIALEQGAKVTQVDAISRALDLLRSGKGADLIMIDQRLDVAGLVDGLAAERIVVPVVACGVGGDASRAAAAIRAGAKEFIPLPPDPELIAAVLQAVSLDDRPMLAEDPAMRAVVALADQIANSEASVLITGESGVGKEVMARYVHARSRRSQKPFISVNCAAIPDNLLESELFGHEKGAFTGAMARRIGKFEEANGGTLLLDEISEMDARLQAKLLRAIQEREIDRVGGSKPVPVDIRILATSNRNLVEAVKSGAFREDLLYRLNVVNLRIPPLRERRGDIVRLAEFFTRKYALANGLPVRALSAPARGAIEVAGWPGNVRELENAMHRAVLLATGAEIGVEAIRTPDGSVMEGLSVPAPVAEAAQIAAQRAQGVIAQVQSARMKDGGLGLVGRTVAEVEQNLILDTLDHCAGNRTHAAHILGISIRTLRNKLQIYRDQGLAVPAPADLRVAS
jgi:DNA-binding NtrC family response regulator